MKRIDLLNAQDPLPVLTFLLCDCYRTGLRWALRPRSWRAAPGPSAGCCAAAADRGYRVGGALVAHAGIAGTG